jgi:asparagine synthase (glutamine-hydrolysing)
MCGIAGIMTSDGGAAPAGLLDRFDRALAHRGPDGAGRYEAAGVALIQRRLAIIDLATGDQPFFEPGGAVLVANGEIYNYLELKAGLPQIPFRTSSDCEVPLVLYAGLGLDFARHLRGMYAIAIHDPAARRLVLARDPFGIKPLYYAENAAGFAFASEPRALIEAGLADGSIEPSIRDELLQLQFTTGRRTIYRGILRVLPGETLAIEQGRIVERRQIASLPRSRPVPITEAAALQELDAVLAGSVLVHQRADVPYGMFLSGGIDSASLLGLMARLNERPVVAFTIGFPQTGAADERPLAREIAQSLGATHVEIDFGEADFWHLLPAVAAALDDPVADYAVVPTWVLGQAARAAGLKVALSGEGGDELFAGYGRYRRAILPWWRGGRKLRPRGIFDGLHVLRRDPTGWRDGIVAAEGRLDGNGHSALQLAQATDCADWLPNDLLTKLDRCLMAHGVEGRTPFLDRQVADFAFRLPDLLKIRERRGKFLLRRWLQDAVPAARAMAAKQGFTVPVAEWIRRRGAVLGDLVARQESIRAICAPDSVERVFRGAGDKRAGFAAWTLLFYALWHRANVQRLAPVGDVFRTLSERS